MKHDISEQEWLEYMNGSLPRARQDRIRNHIEGCAECAALLQELNAWHQLMAQEGSRLRLSFEIPEREIDHLITGAIERIRAAEPQELQVCGAWTPAEGMFLLHSLMEPICGLGTARATMNLAVQRSTADSSGGVNGGNWRLFVANLSEAIASVCGSAAGRLVDRVGVCLAIEEA